MDMLVKGRTPDKCIYKYDLFGCVEAISAERKFKNNDTRARIYVKTKCIYCDNINEVNAQNLFKDKDIISCKCQSISNHPLFRTYQSMHNRCYNPNEPSYKYYGAKGVKVVDRWHRDNPDGFNNFISDMGPKPSPEHSIDRYNPDKKGVINYGPGNCRWATYLQQSNNLSSNVRLEAFGENKTAAEWARDDRCVVCYDTLLLRVKEGWNSEDALTKLVKRGNRLEAFGEIKQISEWYEDERLVVTKGRFKERIRQGWNVEKALTTPFERNIKKYEKDNEKKTAEDWWRCSEKVVDLKTLKNRLIKGWDIQEALKTEKLYKMNNQYKTVSEWAEHDLCKVDIKTLHNRLVHLNLNVITALTMPYQEGET